MRHRMLLFVTAAALVGALTAVPAPSRVTTGVKISGVLFDGLLNGDPEPDSAVRLTNLDRRRPAKVGGFRVTEELTPAVGTSKSRSMGGITNVDKNPSATRTSRPEESGGPRIRSVTLPSGAVIPPGGAIWVASEGVGFRTVFGFNPDYEAVNTDPKVPDLMAPDGFLRLPAKHGTVALFDAFGQGLDFVAYDANKEPKILADMLPSAHWQGPPVQLAGSSPFAGRGLILSRDRESDGSLVVDTNTHRDWDSGFTERQLGQDPVHRIELPGQTLFPANPLKGVAARVLATSAPDNNHRTLLDAFSSAKKSIRVSVYQITNGRVVDGLLHAKKRGVDVTLWLEGSPVGGIPDEERFQVNRLSEADIPVYFLASDSKKKIRARYRFDHSKYVIIDDTRVIIGTENYGRTGVPAHPSYGNRGWMIHVENAEIVKQLRAVWDADLKIGLRDVVEARDDDNDAYGLPYRNSGHRPDDTLPRGMYEEPAEPVYVAERMDLELVLSPDTSLDENNALIGMINRAKTSLYLQQNSVRRRWGGKKSTIEKTPNLVLEAVVNAAKRGVRVRVLLDGTWYNVSGDDDRNNDDTVAMLNNLAREHGLDVAAKIINLETTHVEKIHAKGIIVDENQVFVGSINWTENSFKGNREVGIVVGHPKVAGYYADLFRRDWADSRMYEAILREDITLREDPKGIRHGTTTVKKGARVTVVGEHGGDARGPGFLEVRLGRKQTAFLPAGLTENPIATPTEAVHLVDRWATIEGRVIATKVTDKVVQLRFQDDKRPPFVGVIFKSSEEKFSAAGLNPTQAFQGRMVRVNGRVQRYYTPEIVVSKPEQIEILP